MTKKKALSPGATGTEGENRTTNELAEGSVMNTVPQTSDTPSSDLWKTGLYIHKPLRPLFDVSENFNILGDGWPLPLPDGHHLWTDQSESRFEPETMTEDDLFIIRVYRLADGRQINDGALMGIQWWRDQMGEFDFQTFGRSRPNTYVTNGTYLFVSGGLYVRVGETQEFRAWSRIRDERVAEARMERDAWIAENSEAVAAVQPSWADPDKTSIDKAGSVVDSIEFCREMGNVSIEQMFEVDEGKLTSLGDPSVRVTAMKLDFDIYSPKEAARLAVDMAAAAACLGATATVSHLREAATAAGVSTGTVFENMGDAFEPSSCGVCDAPLMTSVHTCPTEG